MTWGVERPDGAVAEEIADAFEDSVRIGSERELEEGPASINGFRLEKRTTLLRVTGGAS